MRRRLLSQHRLLSQYLQRHVSSLPVLLQFAGLILPANHATPEQVVPATDISGIDSSTVGDTSQASIATSTPVHPTPTAPTPIAKLGTP